MIDKTVARWALEGAIYGAAQAGFTMAELRDEIERVLQAAALAGAFGPAEEIRD
jgi:hypothetical protein